ncbi:hypothetical protein O6H91_05G034000 [Diphasiastrum complanatum]|uniref:Uncharacterized protein n=1 Tax=Diphasiastrum complanatum TaxID=34168 RepID=A0ACC2DMN8_DIPCM|nr:hypothetical protein O6H91_05G034000 [Diphasiastrum complanatum]
MSVTLSSILHINDFYSMRATSNNEQPNLMINNDLDDQKPSPSSHVPTTGLEFKDITYTIVKKQKVDGVKSQLHVDLLSKITGYAPKGQITAVMGPSGAGKSTLLDALAGRIHSGSLSGMLTMDGRPVSSAMIKGMSAYVMQDDQLFPLLTVWETLLFAAQVRLPQSLSLREKEEDVEKLLDQLGLTDVRNTFIGDEGHRGVSGGERRRVSIGVDIIHRPALLFLDEPTSGLDSTSAYNVIERLHDIAKSGSTIIFSIHQPSYRIQCLISHLIILARGRTVFQGSPKSVKTYLTALGQELPQGENPIEYLLDVIQEQETTSELEYEIVQDYIEHQKSHAHPVSYCTTTSRLEDARASELQSQKKSTELEAAAKTPLRSPYCNEQYSNSFNFHDYIGGYNSLWLDKSSPDQSPSTNQIESAYVNPEVRRDRSPSSDNVHSKELPSSDQSADASINNSYHVSDEEDPSRCKRKSQQPTSTYANSWWKELLLLIHRNSKLILRTPEFFLTRLIVITTMGVILATFFHSPPNNLKGLIQLISFLIFTVCIFVFSSNDALPAFIQERQIFIRETSHNAYRASSYVIAGLITSLPFFALQTFPYVCINWFALHLHGNLEGFSFFFLLLYCTLFSTNSLVRLVSALVPDVTLGYTVLIGCTSIFFLLCGYFVRSTAIPRYWYWIHLLSPLKYSYQALLSNQFDDDTCYENIGPNCVLNGKGVLRGLGVQSPKTKWECLAILVAWGMFYCFGFYCVLRFGSKNKRK